MLHFTEKQFQNIQLELTALLRYYYINTEASHQKDIEQCQFKLKINYLKK